MQSRLRSEFIAGCRKQVAPGTCPATENRERKNPWLPHHPLHQLPSEFTGPPDAWAGD